MGIKSGYKIIDLKGVAINTTSGTTYTGIYDAIEGNLGKPLLLCNVVIGTTEYNIGAYIVPVVSGDDFVFNAYGYQFTVDDDDKITVATAGTPKQAANVATSTATTVSGAVESINAILTALKNAGLMTADS